MAIIKWIIAFLLLFSATVFSNPNLQLENKRTVYLNNQEYVFTFTLNSDTLMDKLTLSNNENEITIQLSGSEEMHKFSSRPIIFHHSGTWQLKVEGESTETLWVVPGWVSLLPPILAIVLALLTRQVLIALFSGVFFGALIIHGFNPISGFFYSLTDFIAKAPADPDRMAILIFSLVLGGMVGVITKSGGTQGIVDRLSKHASDSRRGQLATWAMGIFIFFDDYANTLIVGNTMCPLTDRLKISREKLAYLVDSTAAPIATIALVSTWIGYQLSLIDQAFKTIGITDNSYFAFIQTIPFSFYPIFALLFGFIIAITGRDFGSMHKAEQRAKNEGKLILDNAVPLAELSEEVSAKEGIPLRWQNALFPVLAVIITTMLGLWITGMQATDVVPENIGFIQHISLVIGNANSFTVLIWAAFVGSSVAIIMAMTQRILNLSESIDAWTKGIKALLIAAFILTLAWSIGDICKELQTADFVISATENLLSPHWIPTLAFIIAGVIAFSTGTSWATMAILTPIVIPIAYHLPMADATIEATTKAHILISSIAAILAGSTFGDHCSPISDTTIMSSMASGSDHVDHVRTQMPYALVVAFVSIIFGFIPAGFGIAGGWELLVGGLVLFLFVRFYGKKA